MNHAGRPYFTIEIPSSRKAFWDWYEEDRNKRIIYYLSLVTWVFLLSQMFSVLPLTATSSSRLAFYLPLLFFLLLLGPATHWLIQCAIVDYDVSHRSNYHSTCRDDSFNIQITEADDVFHEVKNQ